MPGEPVVETPPEPAAIPERAPGAASEIRARLQAETADYKKQAAKRQFRG